MVTDDLNTLTLSFKSGFVQNRRKGRVIAQIDELSETGSTTSLLLEWSYKSRQWTFFEINWIAIRMWVELEPVPQLVVVGPKGWILVAGIQGETEEHVDPSEDGPKHRGPLRDLRKIGQHLYVTGMGRQVYRREGPGYWVRRDQGVVQQRHQLEVTGFNAIDGLNENDIYAAGFYGEIWHFRNGIWYQIDSPTNLVLHRIRVVQPELAYACGQEGVLLRGQGDRWEPIDHGATREDLWGMEWFKGSLYVACDEGIFVLTNTDELEKVNMHLGGDWTCRHLHANDGVMWSFGPKHIAWTENAKTWNDVTP
jgi:hypothetical protein